MKVSKKTTLEMKAGARAVRRHSFRAQMDDRYGEGKVTWLLDHATKNFKVCLRLNGEIAVLDDPEHDFPSEELIAKIALVMK